MKPIKINIDRSEISSQEIKERRDFDTLLKSVQVHKKPFYKNGWFLSSSFVIAIGIGLVFFAKQQEAPSPGPNPTPESVNIQEEVAQVSPVKKSEPYVHPLDKSNDIPFQVVEVDVRKIQTVNLKNGSTITVDAYSFTDKSGNPILNGKVKIHYREFKNPLDFLISGIPMKYDSSGKAYQLVSADMMEMKGSRNDQEVFITKGKTIKVEMASSYTEDKYNLYYLDTLNKNWVYKGRDKIKVEEGVKMPDLKDMLLDSAVIALKKLGLVLGQVNFVKGNSFGNFVIDQKVNGKVVPPGSSIPLSTKIDLSVLSHNETIEGDPGNDSLLGKIQTEMVSLNFKAPIKPKKANPQLYNFDLDIDPQEFPEMEIFHGTKFEVGKENKNFNSSLFNVSWEDVSVSPNVIGKSYYMTFTSASRKYSFSVYPVYETKDSLNAFNIYNRSMATYKKKLEEKNKLYHQRAIKLQKELSSKRKIKIEQPTNIEISYLNIRRSFQIDNFGVWNSDYPLVYKNEVKLKSSFIDEKGNPVNPGIVYHIDKNLNSLFCHYMNHSNEINFNPASQNVLFAILEDNKFVFVSTEDFKNIDNNKISHTFQFREEEKQFKNVDELRAFIKSKL